MKKFVFNKEIIQLLATDINLIKNKNIRVWANNYLYGHIEHYMGILNQLTKVLKIKNIDRILEVGGVPGQLTSYIKINGFNIDMVDIDPSRIDEILNKYSIKAYKTDVEKEDLPIDSNTYDLVMFNEVFEHLNINPLRIISEIKRVLKKDGILLMSVPNINPLMRWEFLFGKDYNDNLIKEFSKIENIGHMGHFRLYSKTEIDTILIDFEFDLIDCSYQGKLYDKSSRWLKVFLLLFKGKMRNQYHVIAKKRNG